MLNIDKLRLVYGAWQQHYYFSVASGEIAALSGRSGIGKSSLLDAIAGFIQPTEGDIRWQNRSLLPLRVEERPVSVLFQEHNLFEHLSVWRNIRLGLVGVADSVIESAAEQIGIRTQLLKMPAQLSGGQRQRVALLRTVLRPEPLLLLDEPFAELDAATRMATLDWVRSEVKAHAKTVLLVTHQAEDQRIADRQIIIAEEE